MALDRLADLRVSSGLALKGGYLALKAVSLGRRTMGGPLRRERDKPHRVVRAEQQQEREGGVADQPPRDAG